MSTEKSIENGHLTNGHSNGEHCPLGKNVASATNGCPYFNGAAMRYNSNKKKGKKLFAEWQTSMSIAPEPLVYEDYLCLDKILNSQFPVSQKLGDMAHDEHLFIIVHQGHELLFKQILFEMDSIRELIGKPIVDDRCLLVIVQRVQRLNRLWKVVIELLKLFETMTPTDFLDFRGYLSSASGFQSLQFRTFENKFGLLQENRMKLNQKDYDYVLNDDKSQETLKKSQEEPTLLKLIEAWLERTPGLVSYNVNEHGNTVEYNHLRHEYEKCVGEYLKDAFIDPIEEEKNEENKKKLIDEYQKTLDSFGTLFDEERHNKLIERGERKLSHKALWGALFIWINRDEPRFHLPYQLLSYLTDLDSLVNEWRYNHAQMAQRQSGNRNAYSYLKSTTGDRYKLFSDIVNLSTWLIPREYFPEITEELRKHINTF